MAGEQVAHDGDPLGCRHIGQPCYPAMRLPVLKDEGAEVRIDCDEDTSFDRCPPQHDGITGITPALPCLNDIVSFCAQPVRQPPTGAPVNKEFHLCATRIASSESLAMIAWAYATHARTSSGSRSG